VTLNSSSRELIYIRPKGDTSGEGECPDLDAAAADGDHDVHIFTPL